MAADSAATVAITNPATAETLAQVPDMGAAETRRAIEAAEAAWPAWRALTAKERGAILRSWFELIVANADDLALLMTAEQGKPLAEARGEVALRRQLRRMVRRGGQAHLWRRDSPDRGEPAPHRAETADRRLRRHHAVEFPGGDDHAQGRPGAGRRLHRWWSSRPNRRRSPRWRWRSWPNAPVFRPGVFNVVTGSAASAALIGGELTCNPDRAQAVLHRLDRGRPAADGAVRRRR